jgi:hypothetical protein
LGQREGFKAVARRQHAIARVDEQALQALMGIGIVRGEEDEARRPVLVPD